MADAAAANPDPLAKPAEGAIAASGQVAGKAAADAAAGEWKPEPRQWSWKDLFTAPMLAFKPKCMLISALTLVALGMWGWLFGTFSGNLLNESRIWYDLALFIWICVGLVVLSLGATLVSVFMRADLLD